MYLPFAMTVPMKPTLHGRVTSDGTETLQLSIELAEAQQPK